MQITPYHLFDYKNETYLINAEGLSVHIVDERNASILRKLEKKKDERVIQENYSMLNQFGLIFDANIDSNLQNKKKHPSITHMALFVSQHCNLNCIYCYGDGGKYGNEGFMSADVATRAVDWLISNSKEKKQLGINFFGGEPLLNYALIKLIVRYAKERGIENGYDFEFGITTNATLLDQDKVDFMAHNKITPIVSFDGSKKLQDKQRPFKNGRGSHQCAFNKIKHLLKYIPNSICRATLLDGSDHGYVEANLRKMGFSRIQLTVATPSLFNHEGAIDRNVSGLIKCLDVVASDILNSIKNENAEFLEKVKYSGLGWHLCRMIEQFLNKQKRYFACGAGRSGVAISINGEVYLCHRFVGMEEYSLGNIIDKNLRRNLYQVSPIRHNRKCIKCYAKYFCAGGCYHDNAGMTGSISSPADDMCSLMRKLTSYAGMIHYKLNKHDIAYLKKSNIIAQKTCLFDLF